MTKQKWINRAYDQFVLRGVEADEKTWDWAELCYQVEVENAEGPHGFEMRAPEEAVNDELLASAETCA